MWGYPVFKVPTEASGPTLGEVVNPQVEPIFQYHTRLSSSFYTVVDGAPIINVKTSTVDPWEVPELKVQKRPPST
jgi:hypothetical protein